MPCLVGVRKVLLVLVVKGCRGKGQQGGVVIRWEKWEHALHAVQEADFQS